MPHCVEVRDDFQSWLFSSKWVLGIQRKVSSLVAPLPTEPSDSFSSSSRKCTFLGLSPLSLPAQVWEVGAWEGRGCL